MAPPPPGVSAATRLLPLGGAFVGAAEEQRAGDKVASSAPSLVPLLRSSKSCSAYERSSAPNPPLPAPCGHVTSDGKTTATSEEEELGGGLAPFLGVRRGHLPTHTRTHKLISKKVEPMKVNNRLL